MHGTPCPRFVYAAPKSAAPKQPDELAVRRFVAQVGGVEQARRALELLALLRGARPDSRRDAA